MTATGLPHAVLHLDRHRGDWRHRHRVYRYWRLQGMDRRDARAQVAGYVHRVKGTPR